MNGFLAVTVTPCISELDLEVRLMAGALNDGVSSDKEKGALEYVAIPTAVARRKYWLYGMFSNSACPALSVTAIFTREESLLRNNSTVAPSDGVWLLVTLTTILPLFTCAWLIILVAMQKRIRVKFFMLRRFIQKT